MDTVNTILRNKHLVEKENQMKSCQQLTSELRKTITEVKHHSKLSQKFYHFDCKEYDDFVQSCKNNHIIIDNRQIPVLIGVPRDISYVRMEYDSEKDQTNVTLF
jgi:hypothetical protein